MSIVYDPTRCELGEGPLWHPTRNQLFWFDITQKRLHSRADDQTLTWQFDEYVSAAGWVDDTTLLVASDQALFTFNVETGARAHAAPLEADNPVTRSNDGRADPFGGLWIGTMGIEGELKAGAIYRYYRGEVRLLFPDLSTTNSICFDPNGTFALFCDTKERAIRKIRLDDSTGWPVGESEIFIDLRKEGLRPDGAVMDADGNTYSAQWAAGRVAVYNPQGEFLREFPVPASQSTCPAFGGADLTTLFVTSAARGLPPEALETTPEHGMTFAIEGAGRGQKEHKVIL